MFKAICSLGDRLEPNKTLLCNICYYYLSIANDAIYILYIVLGYDTDGCQNVFQKYIDLVAIVDIKCVDWNIVCIVW